MKIKRALPHSCYVLLTSYLTGRFIQIKLDGYLSEFYPTEANVPHSSVLGSIIFLMYAYSLPIKTDVEAAVFVDGTVLFASDNDPVAAPEKLQAGLNEWVRLYRIKINLHRCQ